MSPEIKKVVAVEWLVFLGALVVGLTILPVGLYLIFAKGDAHLGKFYQALFPNWEFSAWCVVLSPYIVYQLIRSVAWALKTINRQ